jgi:hypothetical protein
MQKPMLERVAFLITLHIDANSRSFVPKYERLRLAAALATRSRMSSGAAGRMSNGRLVQLLAGVNFEPPILSQYDRRRNAPTIVALCKQSSLGFPANVREVSAQQFYEATQGYRLIVLPPSGDKFDPDLIRLQTVEPDNVWA